MILVALYQNQTIVSGLIRFWTRSKYSHSELWNTETGQSISAQAEGVIIKDIPRLHTHGRGAKVDTFVYNGNLSTAQEALVWKLAKDKLGRKYDYRSVFIGFVFGVRESPASRAKWFCSEVVVESFRRAGLPLLKRAASYEISPRDLDQSAHLDFHKSYVIRK